MITATEDGNGVLLKLEGGVSFDQTTHSLVDKNGTTLETLPSEFESHMGKMKATYTEQSDHTVRVDATPTEGAVMLRGWWDSWGRCVSGTVGGGGLGAIGGASAASVVPGLGTAVGGIAGGVSGALSGASQSC